MLFRSKSFGGYDKQSCLDAIDALNARIYELEKAFDDKNNGRQYRLSPKTVLPPLKKSFMGGFDCRDVDAYIGQLNETIGQLEESLINKV